MRQDKTTPAPQELTDEKLRAEWERDPKARAEFMNFADFASFAKAQASGKLRILRRPE
ncbi:hypothetical protein [Methylocystis sp.]|uniref:hypothetical protein n=1 Tax=Methylocystis sp. TaxID=1911079 RepID=UPI0025DCF55B|nr:hypothetical protein [Methylocystis sp.]